MPKATLLLHRKRHFDDGGIVEPKLWRVELSVKGSRHCLKYSLYYGQHGRRLVCYDNEPGKGDHRHYGDTESSYMFTTVRQLVTDFLSDVQALRGGGL